MERGSDKHGPRLDDALAHDSEGVVRSGHQTHAEEWKEVEPSGEDQPDIDLSPDSALSGGTPAGMDEDDIERRAQLAAYLHRGSFPAVRELLIDEVMTADAPDWVVREVKRLPAGREFHNVGEVWQALGHPAEEQRF